MDTRLQPRIKRHHNKVRTGCQTCKRRRIKCDEERPICGPCARKDRECEYVAPKAWVFEMAEPLGESTPKELKRQVSAALRPPHFNVTKETLDFRFFLENSLPLLCSIAATPETIEFADHPSLFFDTSGKPLIGLSTDAFIKFWRQLVPQFAYSNPAIWKLACLYGSKQRAAICDTVKDVQASNLKAYGSALSMLHPGYPSSTTETVLMASMVLFAYERLANVTESGHDELSLMHFRSSIGVMEQFADNPLVKDYMIPVRDHFEAVIAFFRAGCCPPSFDQFELDNTLVLPPMFRNSIEARRAFAQILSIAHPCGCSLGVSWNTNCISYQRTRKLMDQWKYLTTKYYELARAADFEDGKTAFLMLADYDLVDVALQLSVSGYPSPISDDNPISSDGDTTSSGYGSTTSPYASVC